MADIDCEILNCAHRLHKCHKGRETAWVLKSRSDNNGHQHNFQEQLCLHWDMICQQDRVHIAFSFSCLLECCSIQAHKDRLSLFLEGSNGLLDKESMACQDLLCIRNKIQEDIHSQ